MLAAADALDKVGNKAARNQITAAKVCTCLLTAKSSLTHVVLVHTA